MLVGLCFVAGQPASGGELADAQVELVANDVLAALEHVRQFIRDAQWQDAVETLLPIQENQGDSLIACAVSPAAAQLGFSHFISVREHCQIEMASWQTRAPEALALYRRRVDDLARRWYQEAAERRDEALLQRIVDELLLSSSGDEALMLLGELALQRGNGTLARAAWERISPRLRVPPDVARLLGCEPGCSWWTALRGRPLDALWPQLAARLQEDTQPITWLAYPDTNLSLAAVRARLILVSLLEGAPERAELEFELLRRLHPQEQGELAGRSGLYVELVGELLDEARAWAPVPHPAGWLTLAGSPERNRVVDHSVDVALRPVWRVAFPRLKDDQDLLAAGRRRVAERADGLLSYHVAVREGVIYISQPGHVRALRIADGQPVGMAAAPAQSTEDLAWGAIYESPRAGNEALPSHGTHAGVPRYSLTLLGERLFARRGATWTAETEDFRPRADGRSMLIGIDLPTRKLLFEPIGPADPGWEFEASPLANEQHVLVSVRRRDPASSQVRVMCYAQDTGDVVWQRDVARAEPATGASCVLLNNAVTLGDDTVYYNTNLGAVAALRASDGRLQWLCRYPRQGLADRVADQDDRHWFRDQTPCLLHQDLVIVAPADCDRILALDAATGRIVWATAAGAAADAVHLMGVAHGSLVASGDYLYWIDAQTGRVLHQFPALRSSLTGYAAPDPRGYGRGVLAGDQVLWPTYDSIYVFDLAGGHQLRQRIDLGSMGLTGGNLVIDGQTLLIAGAGQLVALNTWGRPLEPPVALTGGDAR